MNRFKGRFLGRYRVTVLGVVVCSLVSSAQAKYGGGNGTAADPYQIWTAEQMQSIGTNKPDWAKNFKLFADIDLSGYVGEEFNIIGYYNSEHNNKPFTGIFDGNGHTISNFTYDSNGVGRIGIFGYVYGETAAIKNLVLTDPNVKVLNGRYVGSLVGLIDGGKITNCNIVGGVVSGYSCVGGLVGDCAYGTTVSDSSAECDVYGYSSVGGLAGAIYSEVTVFDCYSIGEVSANGNYVGGLIGYANYETVISHCHSSGSVSGTLDYVGGLVGNNRRGNIVSSYSYSMVLGGSYTGGLLGQNEEDGGVTSLLKNCHATGAVTSSGSYVGGLVGHSGTIYLDGTVIIANCYATGNVSASVNFVGGLVGYNYGSVYYSYATGDVRGSNVVGGLVGSRQAPEAISNCYSTGSVSGLEVIGGLLGSASGGIVSKCYCTGDVNGVDDVGCLAGANYNYGNISLCFWDTDTQSHGVTEGIGYNHGTVIDIAGLPTVQMQTKNTFTSAGWDFLGETINGPNDIWRLCIDGIEYPKLSWQFPSGDLTCPDGVTLPDFSILGSAWYSNPNLPNWNPVCDISDPNDNFIDELDLDVFSENYLTGF